VDRRISEPEEPKVKIPDANQDGTLPDRLRAEAEGILAWCVEGCRQWQKDGLQHPDEVVEATASYREEMDYLGPFIDEKCKLGLNETVSAKELYLAYQSWTETSHEKPMSQTRFGRLLSGRPQIAKARSGTIGTYEYRGIGLQLFSSYSVNERELNNTEESGVLSDHVTQKEQSTYTWGYMGETVQKESVERENCSVTEELAENCSVDDFDPETEEEI